jgi:hypothetical protein
MARAQLSNSGGVDTTVYESYDGGDPSNSAQGGGGNANAWHRRISPELWLWLIVVGAFAGLWALGGSFRKVLS